jgi:hypothetical protein
MHGDAGVVISCHKHRFKHIIFNYIYLISYKNAKKVNSRKRICPYKNDITDYFPASKLKIHCRYQKCGQLKNRAISDPAS